MKNLRKLAVAQLGKARLSVNRKKSLSNFASRLHQNREAILHSYLEQVRREIPCLEKVSDRIVVDTMPEFLNGLAQLHRNPKNPALVNMIGRTGCSHAEHRAIISDYSLCDMIIEYSLLRRLLFQYLGQNAGRTEHYVINQAVDLGIATATEHFQKLAKEKQSTYELKLQTSEDRFRTLFEEAPIGMVQTDPKSARFLRVNRKFCELTGYSEAELLRLSIYDLTHSDDQMQILDLYSKLFQGIISSYRLEHRVLRKDLSRAWVEVTAICPSSKTGSELVISVIHDVTEKKCQQDELKRSFDSLKKERDLREKFFSLLSHDLRTPLTSIRLSSQMVQRLVASAGPEPIKFLNRINQNIDRVDSQIQDLLDATRINANEKLSLNFSYTDLRELVETIIDEFKLIYGDRFALILDLEDSRSFCDRTSIRRAIENLLTNAVKYGDPLAKIELSLQIQEDLVSISVHNEGSFIPAEQRANLFKAFQRSDAAQSSKIEGWGLGLTLVSGIAEAHSGRVRVDSSLNNGTTFIIEFPRKNRLDV